MLIADQLGDVFGQGILEIGQGKVSEKSGNFTFYSLWEPCSVFASGNCDNRVNFLKFRKLLSFHN